MQKVYEVMTTGESQSEKSVRWCFRRGETNNDRLHHNNCPLHAENHCQQIITCAFGAVREIPGVHMSTKEGNNGKQLFVSGEHNREEMD
jgi:hypothetical protein